MIDTPSDFQQAVRSPSVQVYRTISIWYELAAWSSTQSYYIGDLCSYGGLSYECITRHTNKTPTNTSYWAEVPNPLRLTDWADPVTYNGKVYNPFPFKMGEISHDAQGRISPVTLTIGNIDEDRFIQRLIENHYLLNQKCVFRRFVVGSTFPIEVKFKIQKASVKKGTATIMLGLGFQWLIKSFPGRYIYGNQCRWEYKDADCKHTGPEPGCEFTWDDCRRKGNTRNFGNAPGVINNHFLF